MIKVRETIRYWWDEWTDFILPIIVMIIGAVIVVASIFVGIRQVDHHYSVKRCETYAQQTGRETKFVDYNYWDYECLTKANDDKWIPIDNLREVT